MVATYLSEFHSPSYKASFTRWGNLAINVAIIIPAGKPCVYFLLRISCFSRPISVLSSIKRPFLFSSRFSDHSSAVDHQRVQSTIHRLADLLAGLLDCTSSRSRNS